MVNVKHMNLNFKNLTVATGFKDMRSIYGFFGQ